MTTQNTWTRQHLRAPLNSDALCAIQNSVKAGFCANVSEGGCYILGIDNLESGFIFQVMFVIVDYPDFYDHTRVELLSLTQDHLKNHVVRGKVVVRRSIPLKEADQASQYRYGYGCKFVNIETKEKTLIDNFVKRSARNIVFLLNLFENLDHKGANVQLIRSLTRFLGYPEKLKLPMLRLKLLHDYQSLES